MTFEAGVWLRHAHRASTRVIHGRVRNGHDLRQAGVGMRVMAIGASHILPIVIGRMPGHRGGSCVAAQAQVRTRVRGHSTMGMMATGAVEFVGPQQLMGTGDLFELPCFGVAAIADLGCLHGHRSARLRVRIMAIGTADAGQIMRRTVPFLHVRPVVTGQAQIFARVSIDVTVRRVTCGAVELLVTVVGLTILLRQCDFRADLMRVACIFEPLHVLMTTIAVGRRDGSQMA